MKGTKLLLLKIIGLIVGIVLTMVFLIHLIAPFVRDDNSYVAASLDKENKLITLPGRRLILVGGSNLALGVNSAKLSQEIGMPVLNMGLHAGLGLPFALNETQAGLRKGDVVVLSIEYFLGDGEKKLQSQLVDINSKANNFIEPDLFGTLRLYTAQLQRCLSSGFYKAIGSDKKDPTYRRNAFTPEGDLTAHWNRPPVNSLTGFFRFTEDYDVGIERINQFVETAQSKGCKVYLTYPAYPTYAYEENKAAIDKLEIQFKQNVKCPIFGNPKISLLPKSYFFDTVYHLTREGTQKRTQLLGHLLSTVREQNGTL